MFEIAALFLGTIYGLIIGIIPGAGATTGLVALFPVVGMFIGMHDPYLAVVFLMAVVAASTTGDTYTSVILGIPGANSSAATMLDGFPLALRGHATYVLTAAILTSTINGILWGIIVFVGLPFYSQVVMLFGIPELWAFTMLAMTTVVFVANRWWFRGLIALGIGIFFGLVGTDPVTNSDRYTFGWDYLGAGIQLMPLVAGLFAIPEMIEGLRNNYPAAQFKDGRQRLHGAKVVWRNKWLALRGGAIGAFIGALPGLGGAVADWMAYGHAVASTPNPGVPFGEGNIRGVIGAEGANNAQKATSMLPTVLFGIPGAPFAAILIAMFTYLGFEMGSIDLLQDDKFFNALLIGFMSGTILVAVLCWYLTPTIVRITSIPYIYYFPVLLGFIVWACVQYTGGWEDYAVLAIASVIGFAAKTFKFSRPALLIGFILSERVEALSLQMTALYDLDTLFTRPLFLGIIGLIVLQLFLSRRGKIDYA